MNTYVVEIGLKKPVYGLRSANPLKNPHEIEAPCSFGVLKNKEPKLLSGNFHCQKDSLVFHPESHLGFRIFVLDEYYLDLFNDAVEPTVSLKFRKYPSTQNAAGTTEDYPFKVIRQRNQFMEQNLMCTNRSVKRQPATLISKEDQSPERSRLSWEISTVSNSSLQNFQLIESGCFYFSVDLLVHKSACTRRGRRDKGGCSKCGLEAKVKVDPRMQITDDRPPQIKSGKWQSYSSVAGAPAFPKLTDKPIFSLGRA